MYFLIFLKIYFQVQGCIFNTIWTDSDTDGFRNKSRTYNTIFYFNRFMLKIASLVAAKILLQFIIQLLEKHLMFVKIPHMNKSK